MYAALNISNVNVPRPLILYTRKFSPGENFRQFCHLLSLAKFLSCKFFCPVLIITTLTTLVKIYSAEYFCNTKVAGLGEIFCQAKIFMYMVPCFTPWYKFRITHLPVVILRQSYKSPIFKELLNDGTILFLGSITDVYFVRLANLCLFVDEFLDGRREIAQFHTTGTDAKLSS